jgi:hypothetical protein
VIRRSFGGVLSWLDRRRVSRLLGVALPDGASELRFLRWQPSDDLALYEAYIRFRSTGQEYHDFLRRRQLVRFEESGPTAHLPTEWKPSPEVRRIEWWDPTPGTPPDAASGRVGAYGWMLAKYERGFVYVFISDTGHGAETQP